MKKKVVVGLSGGVDSTIALVLLKEKGYDPIGVSLKLPIWSKSSCKENTCCTDKSIAVARQICKSLNIPFYVVDGCGDFEEKVVSYFLSEIKNNKTPNPCVVCNKAHKFKALLEWAKKNKVPFVATGHYAKTRLNKETNKYELLIPKDKTKDQTYGLCLLSQKELSKILFPLENLTKDQVYKKAQETNFDFFTKQKQSQDFCYVSRKDLYSFLLEKIGKKKGQILDVDNKILGTHDGSWFYTIGQRKGLGLNEKYYVFSKAKNNVYVTNKKDHMKIKEINLEKVNLISGKLPNKKIKVKIRYSSDFLSARLVKNKNEIKVILDKPVEFITPGQFCVFYSGKVCLGGAIIK